MIKKYGHKLFSQWLQVIVYTFVFTLLSLNIAAQKKLLRQADSCFDAKNYKQAYFEYQQVSNKKPSREITLKMAECNYYIQNYAVAFSYYNEYFKGVDYKETPEFIHYAESSKLSCNMKQASSLYEKLFEHNQDKLYEKNFKVCKLYSDSSDFIKTFNLDSNYNCINIDASESIDPSAAPLKYIWVFDDGFTSEGLKAQHCFKKAGYHTVSLNTEDIATGFVREKDTSLKIFIDSSPVKFSCLKKGKQYINMNFDATESLMSDYNILEYMWEMGNGQTANGKKISFHYNALGDYFVKLTLIAENKKNGRLKLFEAGRKIEIVSNYSND